ncbi:TRAM domain-containing protein [Halorarius litoreus]|uniref:TRAM domain-containing protein n=1 Tax=Halorarius litoreus TaxID=2962676 RepID=UPI0020CE3DC8|nr:TRAM domain-containing protein [Halorarius litoreus]
MNVSDELKCLFHATVEERDGSYVIEVPKREVTLGAVQSGELHRVGLLSAPHADGAESNDAPAQTDAPTPATTSNQHERANTPAPPVQEGDQRTVDIDDIGEQGDGIARVDRGYIVIVPDTEKGERVTIEITDVAETVGFAEVVSREAYYE